MPEIYNGKNIADFIDPDIEAKLEALEREEDALAEQGFYASDEEEIVSWTSAVILLRYRETNNLPARFRGGRVQGRRCPDRQA